MQTATATVEHFGKWLKREIENRGVSVSVFARDAGFPYQTVMTWFKHKRPPMRAHNVVRLANALGLSRTEVEGKLAEAQGAVGAAA